MSLYDRYFKLEMCLMDFTIPSLLQIRYVSRGFHYTIITSS